MKLYCCIDLNCNNSFVVMINEEDDVVYEKRVMNSLEKNLFATSQ